LGLCISPFKGLNAHIEGGRVSQQHNTNSISTALLNHSAVKKSGMDLPSLGESRGPKLRMLFWTAGLLGGKYVV